MTFLNNNLEGTAMPGKIDNRHLLLLSQILLLWGIILYIYSIYKTGIISNIPPKDIFGLLDELNFFFYPSVIMISISIIMQIVNSRTRDYYFIISLLVLTLILWGTPTIVEKNPKAWDAWGVGFRTNNILQNNGIDFKASGKDYYLQYLQFPGSFILFAIIILMSRFDLLYFIKIYPFFSLTITVIILYSMYRFLAKTFLARKSPQYTQIARFSVLTFILLNSYIHLHLSPESIGWILFFILILLLVCIKEFRFKLLFCFVSFAIVITHPTTGMLTILFFSSMIVLNKFVGHRHLIMFFSMFVFWLFFMAQNMIIDNLLPNSLNTVGNSLSSPTSNISSLPQNIRLYTFVIGMTITLLYICIKKPNLIFSALFLSGISFYFITSFFNLTFLERTYQISYIVISLTVGCIIANTNHLLIKFLPIIFLITSSTLYIYEEIDINPENLISGYNFILNNYDHSFSILQSGPQSQIYFFKDSKNVYRLDSMKPKMKNLLNDIRRKRNISFSKVIALSDKSEVEAMSTGFGKEYGLLKDLIDNNRSFDKIYETTIMKTYISAQ